ncbi:MarR family winged helix-turn-helix transcriptional regulator [Frondihabitans sp. VKM Ac-2883]|uniref:MarR family winged helix-turn-helix transcriptional regulator n=1 Tax=Frondihabitans sp. VKM Ac-2883 TaxID=2783823 RepID=UPI00188A8822|nr:MarR family transcriptional regulator [Frondihabitans sp. VKM Ac-2883]MBF4574628.1 MarR family transcriptional regulator [Frondihabitans sp. VKM Ac-2883]
MSPAENAPSTTDVAHALEAVVTWLRDSREPVGISKSSLSTLARLDVVGPLRITDLAEREGLTQPGMTTLVNRLVLTGLAERRADPGDGRAVLVALTSDGLARLTEYRVSRTELISARLEQLDPESQSALAKAVPALERFVDDSHVTEEK